MLSDFYNATNNKSSAVAQMGDHLTTIDTGRKVMGCCAPFCGRNWDPKQCRLGQGLLPYQVAFGTSSCLVTTDMGRKLGGCAPFGGEMGPHLTQYGLGRGQPPYQVAS